MNNSNVVKEATDVSVTKEESEVASKLKELTRQISSLSRMVDVLEHRLEPVLPENQKTVDKTKIEALNENLCPVSRQIDENIFYVNEMMVNVNHILAMLRI